MSETGGRKSADKSKSRPLSSRKSGGIKNSNISSDPKNSFRSNSILSKEEEYKRLNAELEAKTANLVKEAEEVLREQDSILTNPSLLDNINTDDFLQNLDDDDSRPVSKTQSRPSSKISVNRNGSRPSSSASAAAVDPGVISPKRPLSKTKKTSAKSRPRSGKADDMAVPDDAFLTDCQNFSKLTIQDTIANIEGRLNTNSPGDEDDELDDDDVGDDIIPQAANEMGSEATIRFLKAKLRVMQEELDRLAEENNKKEETVNSLHGKIKELEEERGRLHRTNAAQQSQIDKFKKVADESRTKSENTETQLSALRKELEQMKRQAKQQTSNQSATEVRLNRALEEIEKQKEQLYRAKSSTKDSAEQDRRRMDQLVADNKRLEKQKNELMAGFKKQLKLIDILKRQKMHIEAAKMLSFSEEEFVKALEWGS